MKMYAKTDEFLKKLKKLIRTEFNRLGLMPFDKINARGVKKDTVLLYKRLKAYNTLNYLEIARAGRRYANSFLPENKRVKDKDMGGLVASVLASYNFVTGYLYESEAERKRARQAEEMMTAKESYSRQKLKAAMDRCASLWFLQSSQYAVDIEDASVIDAWNEAGITEVEWVAEDDSRTCNICRERDGKVYKLSELPPKPHYNCRCTYRVREDDKTQ